LQALLAHQVQQMVWGPTPDLFILVTSPFLLTVFMR
jgi:hypothetical protein